MKNVEDVYPLSPMQEVMLFHAVASAGDDALFNQFCYELEGDVDLPAFRRAWQLLVDRHPMLRTAFLWKDLKQPLQVVRKSAELPVIELDWQNRPREQQEADLEDLWRTDREQGFRPSKAPLMRVTLIRCAPDRLWLIWSSHHLLLDRWCLSTVFEDVFALYEAARNGAAAPSTPPGRFRNYIAWVQQQKRSAAESFWRDTLRGFASPTRLTAHRTTARDVGEGRARRDVAKHRLELPTATLTALRSFARSNGLTVSTVFQGAWALLLNNRSGSGDVLFGAAVSGRPPEVSGVESIVGSFINNLPVRVRLPADMPLVEWLASLQKAQHRRIPFEYVSLTAINEWTALEAADDLFDHLLIWLSSEATRPPRNLSLRPFPGGVTTAYPLAITVSDDAAGMEITAYHDTRTPMVCEIPSLFERLEALLGVLAGADGSIPLRDVPGFVEDRDVGGEPLGAEAEAAKPGESLPEAPQDQEGKSTGRERIDEELLQDLVLSEWRQTLGRSEIGPDDNFFDIGGTSLLAAKLHARVEAATRIVVPLLALFQTPTPRLMGKTLRERDWPLTPKIVTPIRARGSRPPLFCIASPEVNTIGYTLLAKHLSPDQPVYVVQTPPTADEPTRLTPTELLELAEIYIAAVRSVQSEGHFQFVSMCSGAHIATEMAKKLREEGSTVGFLGVVNTWAFFTRSQLYHVDRLRRQARYYAMRIADLLRMKPSEQVARIRAVTGRRAALAKTKRAVSSNGAAQERPSGDNPWIDEVGWAKKQVEQPKYRGCVTVFRIRKQQPGRIRAADLGWGKHAERVRVHHLSGDDHNAILREPHVGELARSIQRCLASPRVGSLT